MPKADRSASPPSSTRPPEGVDVGLNFGHVVGLLCGAIVPESDRSALLEFNLSSAVLWAVAAADGSEAVAGGDPCFEVFIVDCTAIGEDGYTVVGQLARRRKLLFSSVRRAVFPRTRPARRARRVARRRRVGA